MERGATCRYCGLTSVLTDRFEHGLCPACQADPKKREYTARGVFSIVVALAAAGLLIYLAVRHEDPRRPLEGFLVPVLLTYLLGPVLVLLHEAAHYAAARYFGWPVARVRIGGGREWLSFRTGSARWSFGWQLYGRGGSCLTLPPPENVTKRSYAAFCLAPSLVEIGIIALLAPHFDVTTFGGRFSIVLSMYLGFRVIHSLVPHTFVGPEGELGSDGDSLHRLFVEPEETLNAVRRSSVLHPVLRLLTEKCTDEAAEALEAVEPRLPADRKTRGIVAAYYYACGRPERTLRHVEDCAAVLGEVGGFTGESAVTYLRGSLLAALDRLDELVELSEQQLDAATDEEARARWSACLALALLLRRRSEESVVRAATEAEYAFARLPWVGYVLTAQAMCLVERGEYDEGLRLFDRLREPDTSGMREAWRVVAQAARGQRAEATQSMERLRAVDPWPACLRRAEAALGS